MIQYMRLKCAQTVLKDNTVYNMDTSKHPENTIWHKIPSGLIFSSSLLHVQVSIYCYSYNGTFIYRLFFPTKSSEI